jgi:hypothetical protein
MTKAAEEQITSVSNLYDVIKSLMEIYRKRAKLAEGRSYFKGNA